MSSPPTSDDAPSNRGAVRVALAGNPNAGKTSIFNALTGARQHVANYPGVTVERRLGHYEHAGRRFELCDLPGTYSLSSYSPEERIAQQQLLDGAQDVVVVVADSTNLKRSLVLLAQVMQIGVAVVLCLNMADEARAAGQRIDLELMRQLLGIRILETVAHQGDGVTALREAIAEAARAPAMPHRLVLGERLDAALGALRPIIQPLDFEPRVRDWVATKLLTDDPETRERVSAMAAPGEEALAAAARARTRLEAETGLDVQLFVTERYFGFVDGLLREVLRAPARRDARALSDAIDAVVVHRLLGLPIFALVMYGIFWLTFSLGEAPMHWIEAGLQALGSSISAHWPAGAASPLRSLLVDGIIGGVGGVLVFLPNIVLLFLGLALLEDTGYMARAAFLLDRLMHRFGLHGKSFVPMMTGFGCSIPGILATRTLESERDRLTTMLVLPLVSCGARLPIWLLLLPAFFPPTWRAPALWAIYAFGIALALGLALLLRRTLLRGEEAPFVMELPPYRLPTLRALATQMAQRGGLYLRKAGTVILGVSILLWYVTTHPKPQHYEVDRQLAAERIAQLAPAELEGRRRAEDLAFSYAGRFGRVVEPVVRPLGFDWKLATAMVGALAAKEVFVAQLGIVYSVDESQAGADGLRRALRRDYSPATAIALMLFMLIAAPCAATVAVTRRESNSWRWPLLQFGALTLIGYLLALVGYQLASLLL